jgi:hypothetical protein
MNLTCVLVTDNLWLILDVPLTHTEYLYLIQHKTYQEIHLLSIETKNWSFQFH